MRMLRNIHWHNAQTDPWRKFTYREWCLFVSPYPSKWGHHFMVIFSNLLDLQVSTSDGRLEGRRKIPNTSHKVNKFISKISKKIEINSNLFKQARLRKTTSRLLIKLWTTCWNGLTKCWVMKNFGSNHKHQSRLACKVRYMGT